MNKKYLFEPELAFLKKIFLDRFIILGTTTSKKFKLTKDEITFTLFDVCYFWGNDKKNVFKSLAFFEKELGMKSLLNFDLLIETEKHFKEQNKVIVAGMSDYGRSAATTIDPLWDKMQKATQRIIKNLPGCKTVSDILSKSYLSEHPLYENFIGNNSLESDLLEEFHHLMNIKLTIQDLPIFKENIFKFLDKYINDFNNGELDSHNKEYYGIAKHEEIFNQIKLQKQGLDPSNIKMDFETLKALKNIDLKKIRLIENSLLQEKRGSIVIKDIFPLKDEKDQNDLWGITYKDTKNNNHKNMEKEDGTESDLIKWNGLKLSDKDLRYKNNNPVLVDQIDRKTKKIKLLIMLMKQRNNSNKKIAEQYVSYDEIGKELEISSYSKKRPLGKAINDNPLKDLRETLKECRMSKEEIDKFFEIKDGYALELYLHDIARTTKDIDLSIPEKKKVNKEKIRDMLQEEAQKDIKDYFQFLIGASYQDLHQPVYGGWRYPVEAKLDNRTFTKFHLDVGIGDEIITKPIWQKGHSLLNFAGILPAKVAVIPREQQFAEKIHSYTFPKDKRNNSRVKDLLDLVLLIQYGKLRKTILKQSIEKTFQNRGTHHLPKELELPPAEWKEVYEKLASECGAGKKSIDEAFGYLSKYWSKIYKKSLTK